MSIKFKQMTILKNEANQYKSMASKRFCMCRHLLSVKRLSQTVRNLFDCRRNRHSCCQMVSSGGGDARNNSSVTISTDSEHFQRKLSFSSDSEGFQNQLWSDFWISLNQSKIQRTYSVFLWIWRQFRMNYWISSEWKKFSAKCDLN